MRFVPLTYASPEQFQHGRWLDGGEGVTTSSHLEELVVGEEVILGIEVRGVRDHAVVRGRVVWKRERVDPLHRLRPAAGVRILPRDLDRLAIFEAQLGDGHGR